MEDEYLGGMSTFLRGDARFPLKMGFQITLNASDTWGVGPTATTQGGRRGSFWGGEHLRGFTLNHGPIKELGDHDGG